MKVKEKSRANESCQLRMQYPKLELSVKGTGIFKGSIEVTEIWTYWNMQRFNSITYEEGQGVLTTIDGSEVATVTGRGVGKLIDSRLMR